jgi:hypothetical protein
MSLHRRSGDATPLDRQQVWEEFSKDRLTLEVLRITPDEVRRLHTVFMLSRFTERRELLEALNRIRCAFRR